MEERFPNLIAALRAACEALPDNLALRAHLNELSMSAPDVGSSQAPGLRLVSGGLEDEMLPLTQAV